MAAGVAFADEDKDLEGVWKIESVTRSGKADAKAVNEMLMRKLKP